MHFIVSVKLHKCNHIMLSSVADDMEFSDMGKCIMAMCKLGYIAYKLKPFDFGYFFV